MRALPLLLLLACRDPATFHCTTTAGEAVGARVCRVGSCPRDRCFERPSAWCGPRGGSYACAPSREECELLAPGACRERRPDEIGP